MGKEIVSTDKAPAAIGPYSQAVKAGAFVFTSGVIPVDPATAKVVEGDITPQATQVMENLKAVLAASGSSLDRVVKTTCFLANLDDFATFNGIYAGYFDADPPARSTVQVAKLPLGVLVEVECVALV
ncbi:MAG: RidA family protein [Thermomicrobiales bacterium]|nr:RidA family protein [Thermomicrobiales bacterium]